MVEVVGFMVEVGMVGEGLIDLALFPSASDDDELELLLELLDELDEVVLLRFLQSVDSSCKPETLCIL